MTGPTADPRTEAARAGRWSPTAKGAALLVVAVLALRAWVAYAGWFSLDDYVFYTRAADSSAFDPTLLFTAYNGHLMPASMLWVWLSTAISPLGFGTVATTLLVLQGLVDLAFYRLLIRLFGTRPAVLLPFAVYVLTTMTLPAMVWWAAALNQLPEQLFIILALTSQVLYAQTGRRRYGIAVSAWLVAGLAFSEKTALVVPLVLLVTVLILVEGGVAARVRETVRRFWVTWVGLVVVSIPYAVVYNRTVESPMRGNVTFGQWVETFSVAVRRTVLPGLLGGPWGWKPLGSVDSLADPPVLAQLLAVVIVGAVVVVSLAAGRRAVRAWTLALLALVVEVTLIWGTRVQVVGVEPVAAEYRYFTDLAMVLVLSLALAFLPLPPRLPTQTGDAEERWRSMLDRMWPRQLLGEVSAPTVGAAVVVLLLVSATISAAEYRTRWGANPGRDYFANAEREIRASGPTTVVYDSPVPDHVIWRLLWPATLPSKLLPPTGTRFVPFEKGSATTELTDLDQDGRLRRSSVSGIALVLDTNGGCLPLTGPTTIRLESPAFHWDWVVQLDYSADTDASLTLGSGAESVGGRIPAGEHSLYASLEGALESVTITPTGGGPVCLRSGTVGLPQPVQW